MAKKTIKKNKTVGTVTATTQEVIEPKMEYIVATVEEQLVPQEHQNLPLIQQTSDIKTSVRRVTDPVLVVPVMQSSQPSAEGLTILHEQASESITFDSMEYYVDGLNAQEITLRPIGSTAPNHYIKFGYGLFPRDLSIGDTVHFGSIIHRSDKFTAKIEFNHGQMK